MTASKTRARLCTRRWIEGVYNAADHYFLYFMQKLLPMQVLEEMLQTSQAP
jgi:hypothetical protein